MEPGTGCANTLARIIVATTRATCIPHSRSRFKRRCSGSVGSLKGFVRSILHPSSARRSPDSSTREVVPEAERGGDVRGVPGAREVLGDREFQQAEPEDVLRESQADRAARSCDVAEILLVQGALLSNRGK